MAAQSVYQSIVLHHESGSCSTEYVLKYCTDIISSILSHENLNVDELLLHISILRQLYCSIPTESTTIDFRHICGELIQRDILTCLTKLLNQYSFQMFVCYAVSKTLQAIMSSQLFPVDHFCKFVSSPLKHLLSTPCNNRGFLYSLQLCTNVLKALREGLQKTERNDNCYEMKRSCCIEIILPLLTIMTDKIMKSTDEDTSHHCLYQLLMLNLEVLRNVASVSLTVDLLSSISKQLCNIVFHFSCHTCTMRLSKLLRNAIKFNPNVTTTIIKLYTNYYWQSLYVKMSVENWFHRIGINIIKFGHNIQCHSSQCLQESENDSLVRSIFLLTLQLLPNTNSAEDFIQKLKVLLTTFNSGNKNLTIYVSRLVVYLVSEQDSCLVSTLLLSLDYTIKCSDIGGFLPELHVHRLTIEFLKSISFDCNCLVDFIIDTETEFDTFMNKYLLYISIEENMKCLMDYCKEYDRELKFFNTASPLSYQLVDYSSSDESEDEENENTYNQFIGTFNNLNTMLNKYISKGLICPSKLDTLSELLKHYEQTILKCKFTI